MFCNVFIYFSLYLLSFLFAECFLLWWSVNNVDFLIIFWKKIDLLNVGRVSKIYKFENTFQYTLYQVFNFSILINQITSTSKLTYKWYKFYENKYFEIRFCNNQHGPQVNYKVMKTFFYHMLIGLQLFSLSFRCL